ncbi:hypothetical protein ABW20_dc0107348 [Dactylellina cionopaga]|nr:hypothetical protein ABW20_dc0107348 [Dactylellina cionopaga]
MFPGLKARSGRDIVELSSLYLAVLAATQLKAEQDSPKPRKPAFRLVTIANAEGAKSITAKRHNAMLKMLKLLGMNPAGVKRVLGKMMLERRRRNPGVFPYPASRRWALEYLTIEGLRELKAENERKKSYETVERIQNAALSRSLVTRQEVSEQRVLSDKNQELDRMRQMAKELDTTMAKSFPPKVAVLPPVRRHSLSVPKERDRKPEDENTHPTSPRSPSKLEERRRSYPTYPPKRSKSKAFFTSPRRRSKPQHRTLAPSRGILVNKKTGKNEGIEDQPTSQTKKEKKQFVGPEETRPLETPVSDTVQTPSEGKGKRKMSIEEQEKEIERLKEEIKLEMEFLRNVQLHANGDDYVKKKLEELEKRHSRLETEKLEEEGSEYESPDSDTPLSSQARALMLHGGQIVLSGQGPSTAEFRKRRSLEIFGKETIPYMDRYEFDSPSPEREDSEEEGSGDTECSTLAEGPAPPEVILVTDYDRNHAGIEIILLPEPTDDHLSMNSSITIPRGLDPVKIFGILIIELHRAMAFLNADQANYTNLIWRARATRLRSLLDNLRDRISVEDINGPLCGSFMGESGTLEMVKLMGYGFWSLNSWLKMQEARVAELQEVLVLAGVGFHYFMDREEASVEDRAKLIESKGGNISADPELMQRYGSLEWCTDVLRRITAISGTAGQYKICWDNLDGIYKRMAMHAVPIERTKPEPAEQPGCYAPDISHAIEYARQGRPTSVIQNSRASLPSKASAKTYHRPSDILMGETKMDAITVVGAMKSVERAKLRPTILDRAICERERTRLPEENWDDDVTCIDFQTAGRIVQSNKYGLFSWRHPRKELEVLQPMVLPAASGCFEGTAQMGYREPNIINERWQFDRFKKLDIKSLDSKSAMALIVSTAPPTPPGRSSRRRSPATTLPREWPLSGDEARAKSFSSSTIADDDEEDIFVENVERPRVLKVMNPDVDEDESSASPEHTREGSNEPSENRIERIRNSSSTGLAVGLRGGSPLEMMQHIGDAIDLAKKNIPQRDLISKAEKPGIGHGDSDGVDSGPDSSSSSSSSEDEKV